MNENTQNTQNQQMFVEIWQLVEKRWQIPEDFLATGEIKVKTRAVLMDWFIQVQVFIIKKK